MRSTLFNDAIEASRADSVADLARRVATW